MPPISSTRAKPIEVDGYQLDGEALAVLAKRARADGKVFSYASLTEAAKRHDDGDKFLTLTELEKGYESIKPTRLPAQQGQKAAPSVLSALQRAWATYKAKPDALDAAKGARVPDGFARVIVESYGGVASAEETFVSVYTDEQKLKRLGGKSNDVYFERKKFGAPVEVFGPFSVDALGIPTTDRPPPVVDDGVSEASMLRKLPSQRALAQAAAKLALKTFDYDATGDADIKLYLDVAKRQRARLSEAQDAELQKLAAYQQFGSQTPAVNDWLRGSPRGKHVSVTLLDQAFERAVELPKGMLLFRGIAADRVQGKRGDVVVDPAYLSTSLDPGIARMFADNAGNASGEQKILMVIEVGERGARGLVSGNKGETEIVLARSAKLHVVKEKREKGYLLLHMRTG